ncbi:DUF6292 family protein [Kutzneria kofuensis]|uniref:DUF6292 domain-containing protein n=1 Tax=Kutzneria kofuensis TaxID=103725 RepID=A0A7W9NF34_9PSEU|nr:DUF6292 family protein [Kutzneria kofuensis]MBB5890094.1 hypothetical protein [Kutzneria kofuensis]
MNVAPDSEAALGLGRYVAAVARLLGVPSDAMYHEVGDLASAYIALPTRHPLFAEFDLMLVWDERHGWSVGLEIDTLDGPVILSYLGPDPLPTPGRVRHFVDEVVVGNCPGQPNPPHCGSRKRLADRLAKFVTA